MTQKATRAWWNHDGFAYALPKGKRTSKRTPRGTIGKLIAEEARRTGKTRQQVLDVLAAERAAAQVARNNPDLLALQASIIAAAQRRAEENAATAAHRARMRAIDENSARIARVNKYILEN